MKTVIEGVPLKFLASYISKMILSIYENRNIVVMVICCYICRNSTHDLTHFESFFFMECPS